jgi:hypothetical protein
LPQPVTDKVSPVSLTNPYVGVSEPRDAGVDVDVDVDVALGAALSGEPLQAAARHKGTTISAGRMAVGRNICPIGSPARDESTGQRLRRDRYR